MTQRLLSYIKQHGRVACSASGDRLDVLSVSYHTTRGCAEVWETIPATWAAVHAWLGY